MGPIIGHCVSVLSTLWCTDLHLTDVQIFILCSLYIILSCGKGRITVTIIFSSFTIPIKQTKVWYCKFICNIILYMPWQILSFKFCGQKVEFLQFLDPLQLQAPSQTMRVQWFCYGVQLHLATYFYYCIAHNTQQHGTVLISTPRKSHSQVTVHKMTTTNPRNLISWVVPYCFFYFFNFAFYSHKSVSFGVHNFLYTLTVS